MGNKGDEGDDAAKKLAAEREERANRERERKRQDMKRRKREKEAKVRGIIILHSF